MCKIDDYRTLSIAYVPQLKYLDFAEIDEKDYATAADHLVRALASLPTIALVAVGIGAVGAVGAAVAVAAAAVVVFAVTVVIRCHPRCAHSLPEPLSQHLMPELKDNDAARKAALADETSRKVLQHPHDLAPCPFTISSSHPLAHSPSRLSPLLSCRPLAFTPCRLAALSLAPFPTLRRATLALPSQALSPGPNPAPCRSLRHSHGLSGFTVFPLLPLPPPPC